MGRRCQPLALTWASLPPGQPPEGMGAGCVWTGVPGVLYGRGGLGGVRLGIWSDFTAHAGPALGIQQSPRPDGAGETARRAGRGAASTPRSAGPLTPPRGGSSRPDIQSWVRDGCLFLGQHWAESGRPASARTPSTRSSRFPSRTLSSSTLWGLQQLRTPKPSQGSVSSQMQLQGQ